MVSAGTFKNRYAHEINIPSRNLLQGTELDYVRNLDT